MKAVRHYYPGYGFGLADRNPSKEKDEAERSNTLFGGDISTRNEAREMNGLPPVSGGDKFKSGAPLIEEDENSVDKAITLIETGLNNNLLSEVQDKHVVSTTKITPIKKGKKTSSVKSNKKATIEAVQLRLFD